MRDSHAKAEPRGVRVAIRDGRKKWAKPELIVLVRVRPEETVLAACKEGGAFGLDPSHYHMNCMKSDVSAGCAYCVDSATS
jgi:hypothetical protein